MRVRVMGVQLADTLHPKVRVRAKARVRVRVSVRVRGV